MSARDQSGGREIKVECPHLSPFVTFVILVIFNRESPEATLIKMPRTFGLVMSMPTHRVRKPSEEIRQLVLSFRANHELPVIRHHAICVNWK